MFVSVELGRRLACHDINLHDRFHDPFRDFRWPPPRTTLILAVFAVRYRLPLFTSRPSASETHDTCDVDCHRLKKKSQSSFDDEYQHRRFVDYLVRLLVCDAGSHRVQHLARVLSCLRACRVLLALDLVGTWQSGNYGCPFVHGARRSTAGKNRKQGVLRGTMWCTLVCYRRLLLLSVNFTPPERNA